ncbi:MAG: TIGR01777 family protein [Gemmatimonadetes bacterium]|nr:TIGR01777 family protein [Gemmatimonadota bacterium]
MPTSTFVSRFPLTREQLFAWHERAGAFERLSPPWAPAQVLERHGTIHDGDTIALRTKAGPIATTWRMTHGDFVAGRQFRDSLQSGPFARWSHLHRVDDAPDGGATLHDEITWALPGGALGQAVAGWFASRELARVFRYRHQLMSRDFARHALLGSKPLTVAITGASGMIGTQLTHLLTTGGHTVRAIARTPRAPGDIAWNPQRGTLDPRALEGVDAVVHLAGASIADKWTGEQMRAIRESRVQGTALLARTLAQMERKPRVLVSTSAVGIYGDRGGDLLDESSAPGTGFLADVARQWESSADPARAAGIRVVHPRFGLVLTPLGGLLGKLLPIFNMGAGGKVGSGTQWQSWVALDDVLGALCFVIGHDTVSGPVNVVAPNPVTNAEFTRVLAHVLVRPSFATVPPFALRMAFGEQMTREVFLASQKVRPAVLEHAGFQFDFSTLEPALRFLLGK